MKNVTQSMTKVQESVGSGRPCPPEQDAPVMGPLGTTYEIGQPPPQDRLLKRLYKYRLQAVSRQALPEERVTICLRKVIPRRSPEIWREEEKAHYRGLVTCGSVWLCPVCAEKISEQRRLELVQGMENWKAQGGTVLLVTQTVPHNASQGVKEVLTGFGQARKLQRNRKPFKALVVATGIAGTVRALEVTFGENGWHVHGHELVLVKPGYDFNLTWLQAELLKQWQGACASAGLGVPNIHGVQVDDGCQAASYATKWGMDAELTKGHCKVGREGGMTPWDFLRLEEHGLFREYGKAFKGKRQLVWSEGLRSLVGLKAMKTDEEVASETEEGAEYLGALSKTEWDLVLRAECRGELLLVAGREGWAGVVQFIQDLIRANGCPF